MSKRGLLLATFVPALLALSFGPAHAADSVAITSPSAGFVTGTFEVSVDASAAAGVLDVDLLVNDVVVGTDDTAPYTFTVIGADGASLTLAARMTDANLSESTSAPVDVTVDAAGPVALIANDSGSHLINAPSPVGETVFGVAPEAGTNAVRGTVTDSGSGVASLSVALSHATLDLQDSGQAITDGSAWSYAPPFALVPGEYDVTVTPSDVAGNVGAAQTVKIVVV